MSNRVFPERMGETPCQLLQVGLIEYKLKIAHTLSCGHSEIEKSSVISTSCVRIVMDRKPQPSVDMCDYFEFFSLVFLYKGKKWGAHWGRK